MQTSSHNSIEIVGGKSKLSSAPHRMRPTLMIALKLKFMRFVLLLPSFGTGIEVRQAAFVTTY